MIRSLRSIAILLPASLAAGIVLMMVVGMLNGYSTRLSQINEEATADIKSTVAQLARIAEHALHSDEQLLFDDLTQRATDKRVVAAAAVDDQGKVMYSTRFGWHSRDIRQVLDGFDQALVNEAYGQRAAVLRHSDTRILALMSFNMPAGHQQIRSSRKGLIAVVYDLREANTNLALSVIRERWPEIMLSIFAFLVSFWLIHRFIVRPLSGLQIATRNIAEGNFSDSLTPSGPFEIRDMTRSFNTMSASLEDNINQLEKQGRHTQAIIDNVIDGILTLDQDGDVLSMNRAAQHMFGYAEQEIVGRRIELLIPYFHDAAGGSDAPRQLELAGLRKTGDCFPLEVGISEISSDPHNKYSVAIIRDITERKKVEALKNDFISTVSHELRTPLTVISGAIALIDSGTVVELPAHGQQLISAAKRNSERLLALINDLLDMEKIMAGKVVLELGPADVDALLDEALEINGIYGKERNVTLSKVCSVEHCTVNVDTDRLNQVLSNFISNAVKFSPPDSTVEVGAERHGDRVRLFVRDYGEGIPEEFHQQVFEKFSQADSSNTRKKGGTGLGLAISRELIARMDGEIGFESVVGEGSTFYVDLPCVVGVAAAVVG